MTLSPDHLPTAADWAALDLADADLEALADAYNAVVQALAALPADELKAVEPVPRFTPAPVPPAPAQ